MQPNTQRVVYLDLLRTLATFGVIALHTYSNGFGREYPSFNWHIDNIGDSLVRWAVPIFVMISGVLFLNPNKKITYRSILTKSVPRLLFVYLFWTVAYGFVNIATGYFVNGRIAITVGAFYPYYHLWFLPMLIGIYLLVPVFRKVTVDSDLTKYFLILCAVFAFCCFANEIVGIPAQIEDVYCFHRNNLVGYAGYFVLGYWVSGQEFTKRQRSLIYALGAIGAFVTISGGILLSFFRGKASQDFMCNLSPNVIAMSVALFVGVKELAPRCRRTILRLVEYVRKDLFGIYLTHAFWLLVVPHFVIPRDCCSLLVTLPCICIVTFILSLYTTKIIRLVPVLRKVVE